jgi:hypothetical protein
MTDYSSRYPIPLKKYMQKTGRLLAHRIGQCLQAIGYNTWICKGQRNGVDLKVSDLNGNLILVAEILNWSPYSEMSKRRKRWIIKNLSKYPCTRLLIYTAMKNESILDNLGKDGIYTLKLGYQILPKFFYHHFERKKQIVARRIDSRETYLHIQLSLSKFLEHAA